MNTPSHLTEPLPAWLEEWRQYQEELEACEEELASAAAAQGKRLHLLASARPPASAAAFSAIQPGQVRVLQPLPVSGAQDLRPALVLHAIAKTGRWMCAPFSPLSEPAQNGEWRTPLGDADPRLAVVSLWDSAEIDDSLLSRARVAQQLDAATLASEAQVVWSAWHHGTTLPDTLQNSVGPRVVRLLDPRHAYEAEIAGALQPWAEMRSFGLKKASNADASSAAADSTLALAASPSGPQSLGHTFDMGETGLRLVITLVSPMEARLTVKDAGDQPSSALEGGTLVFADGSSLPFSGTEMRVPLVLLGLGFTVVTALGELVSLRD